MSLVVLEYEMSVVLDSQGSHLSLVAQDLS